jgi:hypothetical protein
MRRLGPRLGVKYNLADIAAGRLRPMEQTRRRIVVRKSDVLVVNGYELDAAVLQSIVDPERRLLWTFTRSADGGNIQPTAYSEERVIWITDDDLARREIPNAV